MKSPLTLVPPQYRAIIPIRGFRRAKPPTVCLPACPTLACDSILPVTLNSSSRCVICITRSNRTKTASGNMIERKSFAPYPQTRHQYQHQPSTINPQPCLSSKFGANIQVVSGFQGQVIAQHTSSPTIPCSVRSSSAPAGPAPHTSSSQRGFAAQHTSALPTASCRTCCP